VGLWIKHIYGGKKLHCSIMHTTFGSVPCCIYHHSSCISFRTLRRSRPPRLVSPQACLSSSISSPPFHQCLSLSITVTSLTQPTSAPPTQARVLSTCASQRAQDPIRTTRPKDRDSSSGDSTREATTRRWAAWTLHLPPPGGRGCNECSTQQESATEISSWSWRRVRGSIIGWHKGEQKPE